jgi:hypothetical protein
MPNHVTNIIDLQCDDQKEIDAVIQYVAAKEGDRLFDFDNILPMPEAIRENLKLCREASERFLNGDTSGGSPPSLWYDWCWDNWETKWNSYAQETRKNGFEFQTAWSSIPELIKLLSKKFPNVRFNYKYADEDIGHNVGELIILNGNSTEFIPKGGSKEAYDLAFEILPGYKEDYIFDEEDNTYIWKEQ